MQILKITLGSAAFFLCLWLTAGLLGDSLLGTGTQECATASESRQTGHPAGTDDILEAVCLMNGKNGYNALLPRLGSVHPPEAIPARHAEPVMAAAG